jgi:hypothetical protein
MVEAMVKRAGSHGNPEAACVSEIRQAELTRLVLLPENNVPWRSFDRAPVAYAPFQRASYTGIKIGVTPPDLLKHRDGPNMWRSFQDRHDFTVPDRDQWIRPPS